MKSGHDNLLVPHRIMICLEGQIVQELQLMPTRTCLGRSPHNDVVLEHSAVSAEHAVFLTVDGRVTLEDKKSTNGTYVNGQRLHHHQQLQAGDVIDTGPYSLFFDHASVRVLTGVAAGREMPILKPFTTLGESGRAVATIGRQGQRCLISMVDSNRPVTVNGTTLGLQASCLHHGDLIEMADSKMQFLQP